MALQTDAILILIIKNKVPTLRYNETMKEATSHMITTWSYPPCDIKDQIMGQRMRYLPNNKIQLVKILVISFYSYLLIKAKTFSCRRSINKINIESNNRRNCIIFLFYI